MKRYNSPISPVRHHIETDMEGDITGGWIIFKDYEDKIDIAYINEQNTWISVEDGLPAPRVKVLGICLDEDGQREHIIIRMLSHGWEYGANITHWMVLPELPTEGDTNEK